MFAVPVRSNRNQHWKAYWSCRALLVLFSWAGLVLPASGAFRIGFLSDGPSARFAGLQAMIQEEVLILTGGEFEVLFDSEAAVDGDWTYVGIENAFQKLLKDPRVDMIIPMGPRASHIASRSGPHPKPVLSLFVLDRKMQGFPYKNGTSGVDNVAYLTALPSLERVFDVFRSILPIDRVVVPALPSVHQEFAFLRNRMQQAATELGVQLTFTSAFPSADRSLSAIPPDTRAVFLAPLLFMSESEHQRFVEGLRDRKIASFSLFGAQEVENGVMATITPKQDYARLARRVALYTQRILLGENPSSLPITFSQREKLIINMETVRQTEIWPPWELLADAVLLNEEFRREGDTLDLAEAVRRAAAENRALQAESLRVQAGQSGVKEARSRLLPQVSTGARHVRIDEDRSSALGQAEQTFFGEISLEQVLWSESIVSNIAIEKANQVARKDQYDAALLDTGLRAARAYLDLLRSKTNEKIQRDNVTRTRTNLELARAREELGATVASEVYRWESELAANRQKVNQAISSRASRRFELNRILHRAIDAPVVTVEAGLDDPRLLMVKERLHPYVDNPGKMEVFSQFLVENGLQHSPEIRAIDASIDAVERQVRSSKRAFWSPTIALNGSIRWVDESGTGSESIELPSSLPFEFSQADDTDWSVALTLSLPLYTGGGRGARLERALLELEALRLERVALQAQIESGIRSRLQDTLASRFNIDLSRSARDAALKNLDMVTDRYSQGATSILDLIDAQSSYLLNESLAANAVYDFLIDLMELERSIGMSSFLSTDEDKSSWYQDLQGYKPLQGEDQ